MNIKKIKVSAGLGDRESQYLLGNAYFSGKNVKKNNSLGLKWLEKSADQNFSPALFDLGLTYLHADGVGKAEPQKGFCFMNRAADLGDADAAYEVGLCLETGLGVAKNFKLAFIFYVTAMLNGDQDAKYNIARFYKEGLVVKKNYGIAADLYKSVASKNDPMGMYEYACCYYFGNGRRKNINTARKWFGRASDLGYQPANLFLLTNFK